jgi:hypothetical protein
MCNEIPMFYSLDQFQNSFDKAIIGINTKPNSLIHSGEAVFNLDSMSKW